MEEDYVYTSEIRALLEDTSLHSVGTHHHLITASSPTWAQQNASSFAIRFVLMSERARSRYIVFNKSQLNITSSHRINKTWTTHLGVDRRKGSPNWIWLDMMTWKHRLEGGLTQTFINFYLHNFSLASHTPPSPLNYLYHVREGMENIHLLPLSPHSVYSDACFRAVPRRDHKKPENVFRLVRVGFRSSFDVNIWCFRRFNEDIFEKLKQSLKSITNTPPLSWESSRNSVLWLWNSISKLWRINKSNEFDFIINKARSVQVNLKAKLSSKNSPKKRSTSCFRFLDSPWMRRKRQTNCSRTSRSRLIAGKRWKNVVKTPPVCSSSTSNICKDDAEEAQKVAKIEFYD